MTATASEDDKSFYVCTEKNRLIASAIQLRLESNASSIPDKDSSGREFIPICEIIFDLGEKLEDQEELCNLIKRFFEIFDSCDFSDSKILDDMKS